MNRFFCCLLLACISLCNAQAEDIPITLILTNGQSVSMSFAQNPKIVYKSSNVEIIYGSNKLEVENTQISKIVLGDDTSVDSPKDSGSGYVIEGNELKLFGQTPKTSFYVYSIDGSLLKSYKIDADGSLTIPLSDFSLKELVFKSDSFCFKILEK